MIDMEPNTTLVQEFPAHEAVADITGPKPSILVLHDLYGLTPEIRATANRLARDGYFVLAPNLYCHPFSLAAGAPPWMAYPIGMTVEGQEEAKALAANLSRTRIREIIQCALGYIDLTSDADASRVAVVGFGVGGRIAFRVACELPDRILALVAFSGAGIAARFALRPSETMPILEYENLRASALFFYGEQDPQVSAEERDAVARVLVSAGARREIVTFREAGHEFFNEASDEYRISAARDAWAKTLTFLKDAFHARGPASPPAPK
jgi:carboxymethylenebutenolidase